MTRLQLVVETSAEELLSDPTSLLFRSNVQIHKMRQDVKAQMHGCPMAIGSFRGTVESIKDGQIHLKNDTGDTKVVPATLSRLSQLAATTTRK